jgi:hypothetical protein
MADERLYIVPGKQSGVVNPELRVFVVKTADCRVKAKAKK